MIKQTVTMRHVQFSHKQNCLQLSFELFVADISQVLLSNIALSSTLTAATASTKHFNVKVIK